MYIHNTTVENAEDIVNWYVLEEEVVTIIMFDLRIYSIPTTHMNYVLHTLLSYENTRIYCRMKDSKLIENRLKNFLFLLIFFFVNETICGFKTFLYSSYDCFFSLRLKASGDVFREVFSLAEVLPSVPRVEAVAVVDLAGTAAVVGDVRVQET